MRISRNSSIELLRLILMLFILVHYALGICWNFPSKSEFISFPTLEIAKLSINHLCIIAVNVFVLILIILYMALLSFFVSSGLRYFSIA